MTSASSVLFDPARLHELSGGSGLTSSAIPTVNPASTTSNEPAPLRVAYQGEPGAYSEQSLQQLFAGAPNIRLHPTPCSSFSAVFDSLRNGECSLALLPLENSLGGSVHDNYDLLVRNRVTAIAEMQFRVSHCLLALPGTKLEDVKVVYSHPQALAQTESYCTRLGLRTEKQYDTAGSAKMIAEQGLKGVAAVASELAAQTYGLQVLARGIEDEEGNCTRFLLLAPATTANQQAIYAQSSSLAVPDALTTDPETRVARAMSGAVPPMPGTAAANVTHPNALNLSFNPSLIRTSYKTSLVFSLPDQPGTLFKALSVFALRDMHLCKIESRPYKNLSFLDEDGRRVLENQEKEKAKGEGESSVSPSPQRVVGMDFRYLFFIDTLSSLSQSEHLKNALRHLKEYAPFLRVLGSYPVFRAPMEGEEQAASSTATTAAATKQGSLSSSTVSSRVQSPRPLRIGIEGFGTFGQFLARAFKQQGHTCFVHSRSDYSALAKELGVEWVAASNDFGDRQLDVLILSMSILSFETCVKNFPWQTLKNVLIVDVLSVKSFPKQVLLDTLCSAPLKDSKLDILCTHPMFGPESGKYSWKGLAFMYERVRITDQARAEEFVKCFEREGCRMLEMTCEEHDSYAAGSQFLTHTTGRILAALHPASTPINTAGYAKLLNVVEQTQRDSWELYQGLYKFNTKSQEQLEKFRQAFEQLTMRLKEGMKKETDASKPISFNPRVVSMNESKTVAVADLTKRLLSQGKQVTSLAVGEVLSVRTPKVVVDAATKAMSEGHTTYTSTNGMLPLREAIAQKLERENGLKYSADQIVVSNGAKQAICQALMALITPEENEVIVPAPYWVSYPDMVTLAGGHPVIVETHADNGYILSPQTLEAAITPRTKVLILCSPSNPTGAVYTKQQLESLAAVLERYPSIQVISDEIYEHLTFDQLKHVSFASISPNMFERTCTINGLSKGYVMTGFRVGYIAAGNRSIAAMCNKIQGQTTSCCSSISQHAALAALTQLPPTFQQDLRNALTNTRQLLLDGLAAIPDVRFTKPQGAFYVLVDVSAYYGRKTAQGKIITDSESLCMYLLEQHGVAVVPGSALGAPRTLRISYASSDDIVQKGVAAIKKGLEALTR